MSKSEPTKSTLRLLAVMEPKTVTGAAKSMLDFYEAATHTSSSSDGVKVELSIATFEREQANRNQFVESAEQMGIEVDVIPEQRMFDFNVISLLRDVVNSRAPDIILSHHVKSHCLTRASNVWKDIPWVAYHHGYTQTQSRERIYNRLDRWSMQRAKLVVTVCEAFARDLEKFARVPRSKIHVQHNSIAPQPMIDAMERAGIRTQLRVREDEKLILTVGRLSAEKAQIDLIQAFAGVTDRVNSKLVIVGDGPERQKLETVAKALNLSERVVFTGQQTNVHRYYGAADLFALPSHSEGSPYALLEAMSSGLPIVATRVGGVGEMVVTEESALLVPAREPSRFGDALIRVLTGTELASRLANNARQLVTSRFLPETTARALINVYQGVLSQK